LARGVTFKERDLAAASKAARRAGVHVRKIVVRRDEIVIIPGPPAEPGPDHDVDTDPETEAALEPVRNAKV
jgi:hypothetical protein